MTFTLDCFISKLLSSVFTCGLCCAHTHTLQDLVDNLKSELSGNFENVLVGLMMPIDEFGAYSVKKAVKGAGTDEEALIEVICTANNEELSAIKDAYKKCKYAYMTSVQYNFVCTLQSWYW